MRVTNTYICVDENTDTTVEFSTYQNADEYGSENFDEYSILTRTDISS